MDISTILKALGESGTAELTKQTGASDSQINTLMKDALPALLGAMQNNAKDSNGAAGLSKALDDHANDDISDIAGFLKNVDMKDGAKILSHVFGSNESKVENALAEKSGLSTDQVVKSLSSIAPLLLSFLGKEKKSKSSNDGDLLSMLGGMLGGNTSDLAETLLGGLSNLFK